MEDSDKTLGIFVSYAVFLSHSSHTYMYVCICIAF